MREVVKAIIYKDNKYLLQLRDNKEDISYPNHWCFFGGEVDNGETHAAAIKREINEELSWKPDKIKYHSKSIDIKTNCNITYYSIEFNYSKNKLRLLEGQNMNWFSIEEMSNLKSTPNKIEEIIFKKS